MIAAHAHPLPTSLPSTLTARGYAAYLLSRVLAAVTLFADRLGQLTCGLGGHTMAFRFEPTRMSLHCLNCGHTTPGVVVGASRGNVVANRSSRHRTGA